MDRVTGQQGTAPPDPPGWSRRPACALSGGTPGPGCTEVVQDWVPVGEPDRSPCAWHAHRGCVDWPPELVGWARDQGLRVDCGEPPPFATASIAYPAAGTVLYIDPRIPADHQRVPLRAEAAAGSRLEWEVDGQRLAVTDAGEPAMWQPRSTGQHEIAVTVEGRRADTVTVEVRGHP